MEPAAALANASRPNPQRTCTTVLSSPSRFSRPVDWQGAGRAAAGSVTAAPEMPHQQISSPATQPQQACARSTFA